MGAFTYICCWLWAGIDKSLMQKDCWVCNNMLCMLLLYVDFWEEMTTEGTRLNYIWKTHSTMAKWIYFVSVEIMSEEVAYLCTESAVLWRLLIKIIIHCLSAEYNYKYSKTIFLTLDWKFLWRDVLACCSSSVCQFMHLF